MATHSSVLAWRIPGLGEPGGLLSIGSNRVGHDGSDSAAAAAAEPHTIFIWPKAKTVFVSISSLSVMANVMASVMGNPFP